MSRRFDRAELAFFAVPRTWREIEMRFGLEAKTEAFRDCVILADNEGGAGFLKYLHPIRHRLSSGCDVGCWVLTDMGKNHVGERLIARELRVYPDERAEQVEREEAGEAFNEALGDLREAFAGLLDAPGPLEAHAIEPGEGDDDG